MLNDHQFEVTRRNLNRRPSDTTEYQILDANEEPDLWSGSQPMYGQVSVSHPQIRDTTRAIDLENPPELDVGEQGKLVVGRDYRRSAVMNYLEVSDDARHMVPSLLGLAQNDSYRMFGSAGQIQPDTDLSPHSSKLVGRLQSLGVVDSSAPTDVTNDMVRTDGDVGTTFSHDAGRVTPEELRAGTRTVRSMVREGRKSMRQPKPQGEQGEMFKHTKKGNEKPRKKAMP